MLAALESNDFGLPDGCSVDYDLTVVEMLKALSRTTSRDAIEEYCRAYMEEEGLRPTAAQTFRAGHDPAVVTGTYGSWLNFLRVIDLLGEREAAVVDSFGDTLRAIQLESITKSYKLIAIRSLLHEGALRTGDDVANNAAVSRRLLLADPASRVMYPSRNSLTSPRLRKRRWANYWRKWPVAHLTGTGPDGARTIKLFRLDGDRIVPTFWSTTIWAMSSTQWPPSSSSIASRVTYSIRRSRRLVRGRAASHTQMGIQSSDSIDGNHPTYQLAMSTSLRTEMDYSASFAKGAVAFATRADTAGNALPGLLRSWFGPSAGHPGRHRRSNSS